VSKTILKQKELNMSEKGGFDKMIGNEIKAIIEVWRNLDNNFKEYWDKLDEIDQKFITEELKDTLYECKSKSL